MFINESAKQKKLSLSHIRDMLINSPSKKKFCLSKLRVEWVMEWEEARREWTGGWGKKRHDRRGYWEKEAKNIYMYEGKGD